MTPCLPNVSWSGRHNTISCPAGHHFREGRWIRDPRYLDGVPHHGRSLTILYDKDGGKYHRGAGLRVVIDGRVIGSSPELCRLTASYSKP